MREREREKSIYIYIYITAKYSMFSRKKKEKEREIRVLKRTGYSRRNRRSGRVGHVNKIGLAPRS